MIFASLITDTSHRRYYKMTITITHPEKPTEENKIDDDDYMLPHHVDGHIPEITPLGTILIPLLIETKNFEAVSSITFENLNGDTDEIYYIIGQYQNSGTNIKTSLKPNNIDTNQLYNGHQVFQSSSGRQANKSMMLSNSYSSASNKIRITAMLYAKTGLYRNIENRYSLSGPGSSSPLNEIGNSQWSDTTTNITSLVIAPASGTFTGTISLYKMVHIAIT